MRLRVAILLVLSHFSCCLPGSDLAAALIFSDDFNSGASSHWGNQAGNWTATGGVYSTGSPANWPSSRSVLPFVVSDFVLEVDVNDIADGGIWLRGSDDGLNGVLLVTGGHGWGFNSFPPGSGTALYWHRIVNGVAFPIENAVNFLFTPEVSDARIRVEVSGDTYKAFLNGSNTPTTVLTTNLFSSGKVGLYDFSVQTFDNFVLSDNSPVPEPASLALCAVGALGLVFGGFRRHRRAEVRPLSSRSLRMP